MFIGDESLGYEQTSEPGFMYLLQWCLTPTKCSKVFIEPLSLLPNDDSGICWTDLKPRKQQFLFETRSTYSIFIQSSMVRFSPEMRFLRKN